MASGRSRNREQSPRKSDRMVMTTSTGAWSSRVASMSSCTNDSASASTESPMSVPWKRNSSSNWSTTTSRRPSPNAALWRAASTSPKALRRRVASTCAVPIRRIGIVGAEDAGSARARARLWIGLRAGPDGRDAPVRADPGREPAVERGEHAGGDERRLPAGRRPHDRHEPGSRQLGEELVDVGAAAEEQVAPRTPGRAGVRDRGWPAVGASSPSGGRSEPGGERREDGRREPRGRVEDQRFVGLVPGL